MGKVNPVAKWDLNSNTWNYHIDDKDIGRSFSYIDYNDVDKDVNYIIISPGARVEDCSKDRKEVKTNYMGIKNIVNHYTKMTDNYNIKMYLMDADAPIIEDAKLMAKQIDNICKDDNTKSVTLIGYSKCGVMNFYIPSFFENKESYKKTNIFNVATPYTGTIMASHKYLFPLFNNKLNNIFHNKKISNFLTDRFIDLYESVSSNSHMDYDISLEGGIDDNKKYLYDETFIKNVFRKENIKAIKKLNSFTNITTGIDETTIKESIKNLKIENLGLCLLNNLVFNKKSDGMVPINSQKRVEEYLDIKSRSIKSCVHNVNTNKRCLNELLSIVDETAYPKEYIKR